MLQVLIDEYIHTGMLRQPPPVEIEPPFGRSLHELMPNYKKTFWRNGSNINLLGCTVAALSNIGALSLYVAHNKNKYILYNLIDLAPIRHTRECSHRKCSPKGFIGK